MRILWPGILLVALMFACGNGPENDGDELSLDPSTLEATTPHGTLTAKEAPEAYVGAVDEELFIAVGFWDEDEANATVYLCDGDDGVWLYGELPEGESVSLTADDGTADVSLSEGVASGTVTWAGGEPQSFTAELATDEAGLYRAEKTLDDDEVYLATWIVLPDERQRGSTYVGRGGGSGKPSF